jgi:fumarate reductase flavoprotein subunit
VSNLVWEKLGNDRTLGVLLKTLEKHGGKILYGHRAEDLIAENDTVVGVAATHAGERVELRAKAVLIADGGFHANADMLRQHIGPNPERIVPRNAGLATGDGIRMAVTLGAATSPMNVFYGHLLSPDAFANRMLWPYPQLDLPAFSSIMVDASGRRVLDEGLGGIYAANVLARSADPVSTLIVCDADCWAKAGTEALIPPNPLLAKYGGRLHSADTVEALAEAARIDAAGLAQTVAAYNAAVASGSGATLVPARSFDKRPPMPILKAPFYAIPCAPALTNTMGGLLTDRDGRVRRTGGGTIPGLYAAGASTGGIEGGPKLGYVGGLCRAALFGMRAGEAAAQ